MDYIVKITAIEQLTHNVLGFKVEKPKNFSFVAGQGAELAINKEGLENKKRPFTFTSLEESDELEFIIKNYSDHEGVTNEMRNLKVGDSFIMGDAWDTIEYKKPGYFIAGGAGITPFIAILRALKRENRIEGNKLFFSNKTSSDIICESELIDLLGKDNIIYTLTGEQNSAYDNRYIDEEFLKTEISDFGKPFYVCGPEQMVNDVNETLLKLGVALEGVVF